MLADFFSRFYATLAFCNLVEEPPNKVTPPLAPQLAPQLQDQIVAHQTMATPTVGGLVP